MPNLTDPANSPHVTDQQVNDFYAHLANVAAGRPNAIPARLLVATLRLGANGDRVLRALAHRATELGLLLCADNSGYFVPNAPAEVEEMVGRLRSQAAEMNQRAARIESLASTHFYSRQMPLI